MKKAIFIFCVFKSVLILGQVQTIPLSELKWENNVNGYYYKDLDNILLDFEGTWQASWQNKTVTIQLEKISQNLNTSSNGDFYYEDVIIGNFKITDTNGNIIVPYTSYTNPNLAKLTSVGYGSSIKLTLTYFDSDLCNYTSLIHMKLNPNNLNSMNYIYIYEENYIPADCQYNTVSEIPIPLPTIPLIFTKQ